MRKKEAKINNYLTRRISKLDMLNVSKIEYAIIYRYTVDGSAMLTKYVMTFLIAIYVYLIYLIVSLSIFKQINE